MANDYRYFCSRCGEQKVAKSGETCEACRSIVSVSSCRCGVCGLQADVMFVYGYRCLLHQSVREPSQTISGDGLIGCFGTILKKGE
jgi:hypothetical protein